MGLQPLKIDTDYNALRTALIRAIQATCALDQNHVIVSEPEVPNVPRPSLPYISLKITTPASRYGDDTKQNIPGTTKWSSGGPRKMTVSFQSYASSHEGAYDLMALWQSALDEESTQEYLRQAGLAVLLIGTVADLSVLINTGYEGRAQLDCQFGLATNLTSDLGEMDSVTVDGAINTGQETTENTSTTVSKDD